MGIREGPSSSVQSSPRQARTLHTAQWKSRTGCLRWTEEKMTLPGRVDGRRHEKRGCRWRPGPALSWVQRESRPSAPLLGAAAQEDPGTLSTEVRSGRGLRVGATPRGTVEGTVTKLASPLHSLSCFCLCRPGRQEPWDTGPDRNPQVSE